MLGTHGAIVAATIVSFWCIAVFLTFYNKWVFMGYGFHFPLSYCVVTFSTQFIAASTVKACADVHPLCSRLYTLKKSNDSESHTPETGNPPIKYLAAIGVCTALEIAGSSASLLTLSVAFHTIVKSSTPVFVLFYAVLLKLQEPNVMLLCAILCVTVGIVLAATAGDESGERDDGEFAWDGFFYVLGAANAGGVRWALCELMMQNTDVRMQPVGLMIQTVPYGVLTLPLLVFFLETPAVFSFLQEPEHVGGYLFQVIGLAAGCGLLAFLLLFSELFLIRLTSSLTMSIAAVCKEMVIVCMSVAFRGESLNSQNLTGFALCMAGVSLYKYDRTRQSASFEGVYSKLTTASSEEDETLVLTECHEELSEE